MSEFVPPLGPRLKDLRLASGLSLRDLAKLAGCSAGFLSLLEQDKSSPTVGMLTRLCEALGTNISDFLRPAEQVPEPLIIRANRNTLRTAKAWSTARLAYLLPDNVQHHFTALLLDVEPGGQTWPLRQAKFSMWELAVVLTGSVELQLGETRHPLKRNDTIYYDLKSPHAWHNPGGVNARVLLVNPHAFHLINDNGK
ncbi:MAG: cupin domain-containing protein [Candidatus Methylacidiphilales bacterium]